MPTMPSTTEARMHRLSPKKDQQSQARIAERGAPVAIIVIGAVATIVIIGRLRQERRGLLRTYPYLHRALCQALKRRRHRYSLGLLDTSSDYDRSSMRVSAARNRSTNTTISSITIRRFLLCVAGLLARRTLLPLRHLIQCHDHKRQRQINQRSQNRRRAASVVWERRCRHQTPESPRRGSTPQ